MTKLTQEKKQNISKELINNWSSFQKAQWLIKKIEDFENYFSSKHELGEKAQSFLTDEELKDLQNPPSDSDLKKVIQTFQSHEVGEILTDLINYELKIRETPTTSVQSIEGVMGNVSMKSFSPYLSSSTSLKAENIQSISKVGKDLTIEGDFSPSWGGEKIVEKLQKETVKNLNVLQEEFQQWNSTEQNQPVLKNLISKGGYGEVYYGEWKSQEVAVKKLHLSKISESDLKDIQKEIDILKNLKNRYIIQYYGTYFENQELFIIMDYAENGTLTKFIDDNQNKSHDWSFNTNLIKQITLGLAYIHHENIIHRDLKSMNILLTKNNEAKISDFGLSRTEIISSYQSKRSSAIGTLRWMAPETLKEQRYSKQSDIYSLGMIIWEISAKCTRPFKDTDSNLAHIFIINGRKETIPNDTPKNICNVIENCWKDNPSERISLEKIIKMIENNDELGSPTACIKHSIETLKISETQDSHSQLNKFSNSLMLNSEVMGKILNEQKTSTLHPNQEIDFKKNLQEVKIRLQGIINTVKDKLKSKSKISSHVKKRNEELEELFRDFSTSPKEFAKSLDNIKKNLSKKLSEEEIKALCQTKIELVKLTELSKQVQTEPQSQIQISPKSN